MLWLIELIRLNVIEFKLFHSIDLFFFLSTNILSILRVELALGGTQFRRSETIRNCYNDRMLNISAHAIWIWDHLKQPNIYIRESLNLQKKNHERRKVDNSSLAVNSCRSQKNDSNSRSISQSNCRIFFVSVLVIVCFLHTHTHRHVIHDSDKLPKVHILRECSSALRAILLITDRNKSSQRVAVNIN